MKPGDRVRFLNDIGGGVIIRFLDPETVLIKIEDGFEVPMKLGALIPDKSMETEVYQSEKQKEDASIGNSTKTGEPKPVNQGEERRQNDIDNQTNSGRIYMAFTHEDKLNHFKIHLINDSDYNIYFIIGSRKLEQHLYQYSGMLEANTKIALGKIRFTKTDEPTIYSIQYSGYKSGYYKPFTPVDCLIEIETKSLTNKEYEMENDFFDEPAALFLLESDYSGEDKKLRAERRKLAEKEFIFEKIHGNPARRLEPDAESSDILEVDLHIHEIREEISGLSEGEMLDIQLKKFEEILENALNSRIKKVVFIHGVGQGKLKYEITRILNKKYPDLKYQDASFKEYGYGATMVLL